MVGSVLRDHSACSNRGTVSSELGSGMMGGLEAGQGRGDCGDPTGDEGLLGLETVTPEWGWGGGGQRIYRVLSNQLRPTLSLQTSPNGDGIRESKCHNMSVVQTMSQVSQYVRCPGSHGGELQEWSTQCQGIEATHFFLP